MDNETKQVIQDLINVIEQNKDEMISGPVDYALNNAKAKLAEHEPAIDNPVAWVEVEDRTEGPYEFHGIEYLPRGKHNLYVRQPKREPLSLDECIADYLSDPSNTCESVDEFLLGIRYAEKMHGIGS